MAELTERAQAVPSPASGRSSRVALPGWLVAVVPAAAAFLISGAGLGGPSLWRDEAYTKDAISRPLGQLFTLLNHNDAVHGAYYVLIHAVSIVIGTSDVALRLPSLCAMTVAAGFTALVARRAALMAQAPWPDATGLTAGLLFAVLPYTTYYAQMARSYAFVTMFATIASYLLLRALVACGPRCRWWWAGYGLAVALTGLFNSFGLLILVAHFVTMLIADRPRRGWLIAGAAGVLVLIPVLMVSYRQRGQIGWMTKPHFSTVVALVKDFAGSKALVLPIALLALGGVAAAFLGGDPVGGGTTGPGPLRRMTPAAIALPWLVLPPVILLAGSEIKPAYSPRYVEFCLPALAILVAAGMTGLVRVLAGTPLGRQGAWAAAGLVVVVLAVLLISPQHAIRQTSARPDNLRGASAIVAANEQPGDAVFYIPGSDMRVLGTGYPAPFSKLRDLALAVAAGPSGTLAGREISSPAELASRFTDVKRVWVVSGNNTYKFPVPSTAMDKKKLALLSGMHILHRWMAGEVMLTLYGY
ncbi:MAG TPA: hypothetical protein VKU39_15670 [Streptosporangiaceae bacterium]|nr:hypothetical protein [Streptosporangiaceae bacterium]